MENYHDFVIIRWNTADWKNTLQACEGSYIEIKKYDAFVHNGEKNSDCENSYLRWKN